LINFVNSYDQLETPEEMSRSEEVLELTGGILARQQEQEHRMSQGSINFSNINFIVIVFIIIMP
jgi:hypothetical protein